MLFESKEKADNFIRFNSDEMVAETGKAPVRSYYCALCCGWHVTSNPSTERGEIMDGRDAELISWLESQRKAAPKVGKDHESQSQKNEKQPKPTYPSFMQLSFSVETVKHLMRRNELERAEAALEDIRVATEETAPEDLPDNKRADINERLNGCEDVLKRFRETIKDKDALTAVIEGTPGTKWNALLKAMVRRYEYGRMMDEGLANLPRLAAEGRFEEAEELVFDMRALLKMMKAIYNVHERHVLEKRLDAAEQLVHPEWALQKAEQEKKERLLSAISRAELAAKAAAQGKAGLCLSFIENAREYLMKVEDCPDKVCVQEYLQNLEESL